MKNRLMQGQLAEIRFMDHTENVGATVLCVAVGRVLEINRKQVVLQSWYLPEHPDLENNATTYAIDRRTIEDCWQLRRYTPRKH